MTATSKLYIFDEEVYFRFMREISILPVNTFFEIINTEGEIIDLLNNISFKESIHGEGYWQGVYAKLTLSTKLTYYV